MTANCLPTGCISFVYTLPMKTDASDRILIAGGKILARRCGATSKRTKRRCGTPAMRGKPVCRFHGGKSTGPKTEAGRQRIVDANTVHGRETRAIRERRSRKLQELKELEKLMKMLWMIS